MAEAFFVTGTDTGVGKTLVAAALLLAARSRGLRTLGIKPVASGSAWVAGKLRNEDALALQSAMSEALPYAAVNPVVLEPPIAPHVAAREAGIELRAGDLVTHCRRVLAQPHDFAVVEGAGGWRVPLNDNETLADVAIGLGLPVILVVGVRLGCINHALLSAEAVRRDGLRLAGWVANQVDPDALRVADSIAAIAGRIAAPCLGELPWQAGVTPGGIAARLDLDPLAGHGGGGVLC